MKNCQQKAVDQKQDNRKLEAPPVTDYMVRELITFREETIISEVIDS